MLFRRANSLTPAEAAAGVARGELQLGQLVHGRLAVSQPVKQSYAGRLCEEPKASDDQFDQFTGERRRMRHAPSLHTYS